MPTQAMVGYCSNVPAINSQGAVCEANCTSGTMDVRAFKGKYTRPLYKRAFQHQKATCCGTYRIEQLASKSSSFIGSSFRYRVDRVGAHIGIPALRGVWFPVRARN